MATDMQFEEFDEAGSLIATYVESQHHTATSDRRIDVILPDVRKTTWERIIEAFLPAGYPNSVTQDYMQYQIYDSLQAFASSIAGLIASRAVLEGVGVGDATASPTAALLLSILQDSTGRVATILFAHRLGTALEPECKMWRLAADVFNDAAMILDCLSPAFPKPLRVIVLSFSSMLRALCGVAAGSAKASLSAHFARWGNLGELNAKDSSQETVISLLGMLAGSVVVSWVSTPLATWSVLMLLLAVHLGTNHAAVRAVELRTLNRQRSNILFSNLIETGALLTPGQVAQRERVFEWDGVLRWNDHVCMGHCSLGVTLPVLMESLAESGPASGGIKYRGQVVSKLLALFETERYILWYNVDTQKAHVVMMQGSQPIDQVQGWVHALLVSRDLRPGNKSHATAAAEASYHVVLAAVEEAKAQTRKLLGQNLQGLKNAGWDLDTVALETRSGTRLRRCRVS